MNLCIAPGGLGLAFPPPLHPAPTHPHSSAALEHIPRGPVTGLCVLLPCHPVLRRPSHPCLTARYLLKSIVLPPSASL